MENNPARGATARPHILRRLGLLVAAVFTVSALVGLLVAGPAQAAPAKTTLAVAVSSTSVASGGKVTVTATLKKGTKALAGTTVTLQRRVVGASTWKTLKTGRTTSQGQLKATASALAKNTEFRAVFKGTSAYYKATSSKRTVTVRQKISITSSSPAADPNFGTTADVTAGKTVTLKGTVSTALANSTLQVQRLSSGTWKKVASVKAVDGRFTAKFAASGVGTQSYRIHYAGRTAVAAASSSTKKFKVFQWYRLSSVEPIDGTWWDNGLVGFIPDAGEIAGVFYDDVLFDVHGLDEEGSLPTSDALWYLGGACKSFTTKVGFLDDSEFKHARAHFYAEAYDAEGWTVFSGFFGTRAGGEKALSYTTDITGYEVLKLAATFDTPSWDGAPKDTYAYPAFADAKVLCSNRP